jgi:hypothetical protein
MSLLVSLDQYLLNGNGYGKSSKIRMIMLGQILRFVSGKSVMLKNKSKVLIFTRKKTDRLWITVLSKDFKKSPFISENAYEKFPSNA